MSYKSRLTAAAEEVARVLSTKYESKIGADPLEFDGPTEIDTTKVRAPTQSNSKFQAEQALGDWAEDTLLAAINDAEGSAYAIHYGDDSKLRAEDEGFREAYREGVRQTFLNGKKSDLLLIDRSVQHPGRKEDIAEDDWKRIVRNSIGGVEVRSSRLTVETNRAYHRARHKGRNDPKEPNFTVKIEDLKKVFVWNYVHEKPQAYAQVFFDDIYAMSFIEILQYICGASKLDITKHARSDKTTIMVPISNGTRIGSVIEPSYFEVDHNVTNSGRHDIFARPLGGRMDVDVETLRSVLEKGA